MEILELFKRQLLENKSTSSKSTLKNYLSDVRHFISWFEQSTGSGFQPENITADTITLYEKTLGGIVTNSKLDNSTQLSTSSMKRHLSSLRSFFSFLEKSTMVQQNPFKKILPEVTSEPTDLWHLKSFKDSLQIEKASKLTIKNYLSDISGFAKWYEETVLPGLEKPLSSTGGFYLINQDILEDYRKRLLEIQNAAPRTVNRKLSALRKYLAFATEKGFITSNELTLDPVRLYEEQLASKEESSIMLSELPKTSPKKTAYSKFPPVRLAQKLLFFPYLLLEEKAATAIASFVAGKPMEGVEKLPPKLAALVEAKNNLRSTTNSVSSLLGIKNVAKEFYAPEKVSLLGTPLYKRVIYHFKYTRPNWYKRYHNYSFVHYVHFALLVIFASGVGVALYQNLVAKKQAPTFAAATAPPRIISFQGRLTDNLDNPITSTSALRFAIYNDASASGGALLWQEAITNIVPDQDGIFSILLGGGTQIPSTVFTDNSQIYLGVTVGVTSELTPRQRIASVGYATNAEFLQGQPPTTQAGLTSFTNVILALDSSGNLTLADSGVTNHTFQVSNGAFNLKGQSLYLTTNTGSGGNVILSPDGLGKNDIQRPIINTTTMGNIVSGGVEVNDRFGILATESAVAAFIVNNNTSGGDILAASSSGTTRFKIANDGTLTDGFYNTAGGLIYGSNSSGAFAQTTAGSLGQCLQSAAGAAPTWGTCGSDSPFFELAGSIVPLNSTEDLLVGGQTTASAKFRFINNNTGTPIASISANLGNNATFLSGDGTLGTTNRQTLTIGNSSTYNTTGNLLLNPNGFGKIGIGTTSPLIGFDLRGNSGTTPAASISANTSYATLLVDNSGVGDLIAASASGVANFVVKNNGDVIIGQGGGGKLTVSVIDPYLVQNQKTTGTQSLTFQTMGATNADFVFKNVNTTLSTLTQAGQLQIPITGSTGGIVIGGDTQLFRGSSDRLDLASGDSFNVVSGNIQVGGTTVIDSSRNGTFQTLNVTGGCTGCTVGAPSPFQELTGSIVPLNGTWDLLVGSQATTSAKFAVLNLGNGGTPTASVSSGLNGTGAYFDASGNFQTVKNQTLTIGGSSTGGITLTPSGGTGLTTVNGRLAIATTTSFDNSIEGLQQTGTGDLNVTARADLRFNIDSNNNGSNSLRVFANGNTTEVFRIQDDGSVGIGTTTPTALLDVAGTASVSGAFKLYGTPTIQSTSNQTLTIGGDTTGNIILSPSNGTGRVGIGTNTPTAALHLVKSGTNDPLAIFENGSGGSVMFTSANNTNFQKLINVPGNDNFTTGSVAGDSGIVFANGGNYLIGVSAGYVSQYFKNNNTIGLGTNSPVSELHVTRPLTYGVTGKALAIFDQIENQDILTASSAGITKFTLKNDGNASSSAGFTIDGIGALQSTKNQTLTIGGNSTGAIVLSPNNGSGSLRFTNFTTNGGILYTNAAGVLAQTGAGSSLQCLLGDLSWGTCATGTTSSPFFESLGSIKPFNSTEDFFIGGQATGSAKFAVLSVNNGTPTASVSSGLNGTASLYDANGNFQTANKMTLTLGGGNTGNIIIQGNGSTTIVDQAIRLNAVNPTLSANGTYTLTFNNNSTGNIQFFSSSNTLTSAGALTIAGNATINGGTVQLANGSQGTIQTTSNADIVITAGSGTINLNTVSNGAVLTGSGLTTLGGGLTVNGATTTFGNAAPLITTGTNTDLTITPNGTGDLIITSDFNTGVSIGSSSNPPALLSVSGGIGSNAGFILNRVGATDDILAASSAGTTRFVIKNDGTASSSAGFTINGTGNIQSTNNQTLTIGGSSTGNIVLSPNNGSGNIRFSNFTTNNGILYTNGSGVLSQTAGGTGTQCLLGDLSWGSCGTGTSGSPFKELLGAIVPNNSTEDFLIGAQATASAKFAVLNISGNGTPTASVSAQDGSNKAIALAGDGSLQTVRNNTLTIGGSTTGNIVFTPNNGTGNIRFSNFSTNNGILYTNGSGVLAQTAAGVGTQCLFGDLSWGNCSTGFNSPFRELLGSIVALNTTEDFLAGGQASTSATFKVTGQGNPFAGTAVGASVSANTSFAGFIADNRGSGDLFTASSAGMTRFTIRANGNVGIGTNLPGDKLEIKGIGGTSAYIGTNVSGISTIMGLQLNSSLALNGQNYAVEQDTAHTYLNAPLNGNLYFRYGNADRNIMLGSSGNLGLGTITPSSALHVTHPLTYGANGKALATFDQIESQDILTASASGTPRLTLANNGNLSFGNGVFDSWDTTLKQIRFNNEFTFGTDTSSYHALYQADNIYFDASNWRYSTTGQAGVFQAASGTFQFRVAASGTAGNIASLVTGLYINNGAGPLGAVGIGTTSTYGQLYVTRPLTAGVTGKSLAIFDQIENQDILSASSSGVPKFVINNSGFVGVGTTLPNSMLHVNGDSGGKALVTLNSTTTDQDIFVASSSGTNVFKVNNTGATTVTNTTTANVLRLTSSTTTGGNNLTPLIQTATSSGNLTTGTQFIWGGQFQASSYGDDTGGNHDMRGINIVTSAAGNSNANFTVFRGADITVTKSGGLASSTNAMGLRVGVSATNAIDSGTLNNYGLYVANGTSDTNGTSTKYGLYIEAQTGADNNYAFYSLGGNIHFDLGSDATGDLHYRDSNGNLARLGVGTGSQCLIGGTTPSWGSCTGGGTPFNSPFRELQGAIVPLNISEDFLAGAQASTSAAFKVTGQGNPFAGTLVGASVSANTSFAGFIADNRGSGDLFTASSAGMTRFTIRANGNVGIGTSIPRAKVEITADGILGNQTPQLQISGFTDSNKKLMLGFDTTSNFGFIQATQTGTSFKDLVLNYLGGNVGIGTTAPISQLYVTRPLTNGVTGKALAIFDQIENQDILAASYSGTTRFVIDQNGLTTITPIGTGNSKGLYVNGSDSTTSGGAFDANIYSNLALTNNKPGSTAYGYYGNITSNSTTTENNYGIYLTSNLSGGMAAAGPAQNVGVYSNPTSTGASTGNTNIYGGIFNPSSTNATTGSVNNVYGISITTTGTLTTGGTLSQYGVYVNDGTSSTTGTSLKYGLYVAAQTGADNNYGAYIGNNVGIGTATPINQLQITRPLTMGATGKALTIFDQIENQDILTASVSGATKFVINNNGQLGLNAGQNNSTLLASLDIRANLANGGTLPVASLSGRTSFAALTVDNSGLGDIFTASSSGLTRFVIAQNGNVGIGTSQPSQLFAMAGGNFLQTASTTPTIKGSIQDNTNLLGAQNVYVSGRYAYVTASSSARLTIVDVANPSSPTVISSVQDTTNLLGAYGIDVNGEYAYVTASSASRLTVVDISHPKAPVVKGSVQDTTRLAQGGLVVAEGGYAYVASSSSARLTIVDVSNAAAPVVAGSVTDSVNLNGATGVYLLGKFAYVTSSAGSRLAVIDISNPYAPFLAGSVVDTTQLNGATGIYVSGKYAYVTAKNTNRLTIIDVSNPNAPSIVGSINDATNLVRPTTVQVAGNYAYITSTFSNRVTVVDVTTPSSPTVISNINDNTNLNNPFGLFVSGKYAYVANFYGNRLTIVDINGVDVPTANIGNLASNSITVHDNADIGDSLFVRNSINVGSGGIYSQGNLTIDVATGGANLIQGAPIGRALLALNYQGTDQDIFTASSSGTSIFSITNSGGIKLGSSVGTNVQCLLGGTTAAWGSCGGGGTNYWQYSASTGVLAPGNLTVATLFGSTASNSALLTIAGTANSGIVPVASISARTSAAGLIVDNTIGDLLTASSSGLTRLRVTQDGLLGIGSAAPIEEIGVNVNQDNRTEIRIDNANTGSGANSVFRAVSDVAQVVFSTRGSGVTASRFGLSSVASYAEILTTAGNGLIIGTNQSAPIVLGTNALQTMYLDTQQRVGIGTSANPIANNLTAKLQVLTTSNHQPAASISATSTSTLGPVLLVTSEGSQDLFVASVGGQTKFRIDSSGGIHSNGGLANDYGDFAEYYRKANTNETFEAGQIVCLEGNGVVRCSNELSSQRIIGVISDRSFLRGNASHSNDPNYVLVGMVGQLGVWATGDVHAGDPLTFSSNPGVATVAKGEASIIGYAQEGNNGSLKRIESVIQPNFYNQNIGLQHDNIFNGLTIALQNGIYNIVDSVGNQISHIDAFSKIIVGNIEAGFANIRALTVNSFNSATSSLGHATAQTFAVAANTITIGGQDIRQFIIDTVRNAGFGQGTITTPLATDNIKTNVISPLADNSTVQLNVNKDNFELKNTNTGKTVAWFDDRGNATTSGQLTTNGIQTTDASVSGTLAANNVNTADASVSGTLRAGTIIASNITGLDQKLATLAAALQSNGQASNSGQTNNYLASDTVHANFGIFEQGITSMGPVTSNIITATDQLAVGNSFTITNNAINTVGADLQIQSLRQGNIAFEGGLIKMDTDGNMLISGNLNLLGEIDAVHGVFSGTLTAPALATGLISPLPGDDLAIRLSDSASTSGKLKITNNLNQEVLSVNSHGDLNASGSGTFAKLNFNLVGKAEATSLTEAVATGSAGFANLKQGQVELTIKNPIITSKSLIYITPFGDTENKVLYLLRQVPQSEVDDGSFTVGISGTPSPRDIQFNWLIVN